MLLRTVVMGVLCIWCVSSETMPKVISNRLIKNETDAKAKKEVKAVDAKLDLKSAENTRTARQLDPGFWNPMPAVWNPRPRSPLNTWWASPWPYGPNGIQSLVRIRPPSPYWEDYESDYFDPYHHYHHHHDHHDKPPHHPHDQHHHDKHHHEEHHHHDHHHKPHPPVPAPFAGRPGTYIAQNHGAIHIAPLPGHADSVIASNLGVAPGTLPNLFTPFGPISVDISGPLGAAPPLPPPGPPRIPPPPPGPPGPFGRTW